MTTKEEAFKTAYQENEAKLIRLRTTCFGMVENGLRAADIDHLPIQSRVKTPDSAWQKIRNKEYSEPLSQITDFVGLRVIVFLESDVENAQKIIEDIFEIDRENSIDKRIPERNDIVGYRSLHLICSLGQQRETLPEYSGFTSQRFEIQIRTALQHAWAEIEHKRNYKGKHSLPNELQHRLMILAGTIELLDREFSQIASDATEYEKSLTENDASKSEESLSEIAIDAILNREFKPYKIKVHPINARNYYADLVDELSDFGISTVGQFETLVRSVNLKLFARYLRKEPDRNALGVVRHLMMANNAEKYFRDSHKGRWQAMTFEDTDQLNELSSRTDLREVIEEFGVDLYDEFEEEDS